MSAAKTTLEARPFDFSPAFEAYAFQTNPNASKAQLSLHAECLLDTAQALAAGIGTDSGPSAEALAHAAEFMIGAAHAAFRAIGSCGV